jgi:outer membrane protein assembly factor BamB
MTETTQPRRRLRWYLLTGILLLSIGSITVVRAVLSLDNAVKNLSTAGTVLLTVLLLLIWLLLLSGLRWRTRLIGFALAVGILVGLGTTVRLDGLSGDMAPQFRWRWTRAKDFSLAAATATEDTGSLPNAAVDLSTTSPHDYPRFLGADGFAIVKGVPLATDWSATPPRKLWRQAIGAGWSSFSIVGQYAVTQEQRGDFEQVTCYDVTTGRLQWTHQDRVRFSEAVGGDGPRATPTIVDGRVYAMGATGLLLCLDGGTGRLIWSHDTLAEHQQKNLEWGKSCSPLIVDNLVVVSLGESAEPSLVAYDKQTGELVWQADRDKPSYASPVFATLAGRRQILSVNAGSVSAHDPADGHQLWEYAWPGKTAKCSQPVPLDGDRVFISAGYGLGSTLLQIASGDGEQLAATKVWSNHTMRTRFTNVVTCDGFVYGLDDGILECIELATGDLKWKAGRYGHGQVLLVDRILLVTTEFGDLVLVDADPAKPRELARFAALAGKTWNNPALSGRHLLVRNDQEAACYELPVKQSESSTAAE